MVEEKRFVLTHTLAQLAGAVVYTGCISIERYDSLNECPRYDTKQSDGEAPLVLEFWGMRSTPFIAIDPRSILARNGSTWLGPIYGLN